MSYNASSSDEHMVTRRAMLESAAGLLLVAAGAGAQPAAGTAKPIFTHALPDLALKNWSVTSVEVSYPPGGASAPHRHPGITIAYVLEGEIASKVGDGPERTYKTGEMFLETPGELHGVSRNASTTRPARLLAVLLAETGAQLTTPAR
jgi:quercetin dioxygenase-like cupin family protein